MLAWAFAAGLFAFAPSTPSPRGNSVLTRDRGPIFGIAAVPRMAVLIGDARRVIQPLGWGAELQFRAYALHIGALRFGGQAHFGHTRILQRTTVSYGDETGARSLRRNITLDHTDFSLGPSVQIGLGPVLVEAGAAIGLGLSMFSRPLGPLETDEQNVDDLSAMLRGGGQVAVPIRRNQGIVLGVHATQFFSRTQIVAAPDPAMADAMPDANPFDLVLEIGLGYQMWL